ncbi:MAG: hypothetical protein KBT02_10285 [Treponema sp.]|nr:hypothetical protein [Candidatus Treponema caballi]
MIGTCKYCGQAVESLEENCTQEAADVWATLNCDCASATADRRTKEQVTAAKDRVFELFGTSCAEYGFSKPIEAENILLLTSIVDAVANHTISSAKIHFGKAGSASISMTSKSKIKIQRSQAHAYQLEE